MCCDSVCETPLVMNKASQATTQIADQSAQPATGIAEKFQVGDMVCVDDQFQGCISEVMWNDFYRVEVDDGSKPNHSFWTVHASRMEHQLA